MPSQIILNSKDKKVAPQVPPKTIPRSSSTTGLSSLSKAVLENEAKQQEMGDMLCNVRNVIEQYEQEIRVLQQETAKQSNIITNQEITISGYVQELNKAKDEISKLMQGIQEIWDS